MRCDAAQEDRTKCLIVEDMVDGVMFSNRDLVGLLLSQVGGAFQLSHFGLLDHGFTRYYRFV